VVKNILTESLEEFYF